VDSCVQIYIYTKDFVDKYVKGIVWYGGILQKQEKGIAKTQT